MKINSPIIFFLQLFLLVLAEFHQKIDIIITMETDPYQYKFILEDPKAVEEKKQSLREELQSYIEYSEQLDNILDNLMTDGNSIVWKMS